MGILKGISHAIIQFNTVAGAKGSGIHAAMKLCFGSDDNSISQIVYLITQGNSSPSWSLPTRQGNTPADQYPIFNGVVGEEILAAVARASERFKAAGKVNKAGKSFRIYANGKVEEIEQAKAA